MSTTEQTDQAYSLEEATEAALEGAALLDRERPGWRGRVKRDQLDMATFNEQACSRCILGWAIGDEVEHGGWWPALRLVGLNPSTEDDAIRFGFDVPFDPLVEDDDVLAVRYAVLEEAWQLVLDGEGG